MCCDASLTPPTPPPPNPTTSPSSPSTSPDTCVIFQSFFFFPFFFPRRRMIIRDIAWHVPEDRLPARYLASSPPLSFPSAALSNQKAKPCRRLAANNKSLPCGCLKTWERPERQGRKCTPIVPTLTALQHCILEFFFTPSTIHFSFCCPA